MDFLRSWVVMLYSRGVSQECPDCGACKEHVLFE